MKINKIELKEIIWLGSTKKDLRDLPKDVEDEIGYALYLAQQGDMADEAKPLKGFGGANVIEIVADDASGTYRAVYTIHFPDAIFMLHVFQKKSKHGIATAKRDLELIASRLKQAHEMYKKRN